MNDKKFEKQKKRILRIVNEWRKNLGLGLWELTHNFYREGIAGHSECDARVMVEWEYQRATIYWDCYSLSKNTDKQLEWTVVHELCHILVNEMRFCKPGEDFDISREEHVVTSLAWAFIWVKEAHCK